MDTDKKISVQEAEMLQYQLSQMQHLLENLINQINEVVNTIDALINLKNLRGNEIILFPIANGIFVEGKLLDNAVLKMNVGSNVVVDKNIDDVIKMMNEQYEEMENYRKNIESQINELSAYISRNLDSLSTELDNKSNVDLNDRA